MAVYLNLVVSWCCGRLRSPNDVLKKNWVPNYITGRNHVFPYFVNSTGNIKLLISVSDLRKHGFRFHDVSAPETTYHVSDTILLSHCGSFFFCFRYVSGEISRFLFPFFFFFNPWTRSHDQCFINVSFLRRV